MVNKNNIIEEIQEVIQKIKNEYQQGVDYKFGEETEGYLKKHVGVEHFRILSPRLKKFCRERFDFPPVANIFLLVYEKTGEEGERFYYEVCSNYGYDAFGFWDSGFDRDKERKCLVCGDLTFQKNGWMKWWDGKKKTGLDSPDPHANGYFHPECAKKHFANKEQSNENNTRIKEKLLRNLDKLCLDPDGYLANNEYLKTDGAEEEYNKTFNLPYQTEWRKRYLKITIEGQEIDLENWDNTCPEYYEVKRELIKKIKSEIRQNPSEWKIEKGKNENYCNKCLNQLIKHQPSGRRYWKLAIDHYWGGDKSEIGKYWTEIETLINGSAVPVFSNQNKNNSISDTETEKIRQYFQENDIKEIKLENGKLVITHNNNNETKDRKEIFHNPELLKIMEYCQNSQGNKITKETLGLNDSNNNTNSEPNNKGNHKLVIGLAIGTSVVIVAGILVYLVKKRKK